MYTVIAHLKSKSAYSQSKFVQAEKKRETHEECEKRTWKERCHYTRDGHVFIPPNVFANCLKDAAKYLSLPVPGAGKSTYTKHFDAGVMCTEPLVLEETRDTIQGEWLHVPSDGRRGGTSRVLKCFPFIPEWEGEVEFQVMDTIITEEVFKKVLAVSGQLIGIGRFRPRNRGFYGRFTVENMTVIKEDLDG